MAFFTINGDEYDVISIRELKPERAVDAVRMMANNLRGFGTGPTKRAWAIAFDEMSESDYQALVTHSEAFATIDGDAFSASFVGYIEIDQAPFTRDDENFLREPSITVREV